MQRWLFLCGLLLIGLHLQAAGPDRLSLAIGFEEPATMKDWFGAEAPRAPGREGQGMTGTQVTMKGAVVAQVWNREAGTLMAWVQAVKRPSGGYMHRWAKILEKNRIDLSVFGGWSASDQPGLLNVKTLTSHKTLIETGDWRHWTLTWNGTDRRLYLDGQLVITGEQPAFESASPRLDFVTLEGDAAWVLDDLKIYTAALTPEEVAVEMGRTVVRDFARGVTAVPVENVQAPAHTPVAFPTFQIAYDPERQLMANPVFGGVKPGAKQIAPGWSIVTDPETVTGGPGALHCTTGTDGLSLLGLLRRGVTVAGRAYRIGLRYALQANGARATLRFRNMIDQGTRSFPLPETNGVERKFFFATAPEDFDVGIYYLEVRIEGAGADLTLKAAYCREATAEEIKTNKIQVAPEPLKLVKTVTPDERWLADVPKGALLPPAYRRLAWGLHEPTKEQKPLLATHKYALTDEGGSLVIQVPPQQMRQDLLADAGEKPGTMIHRLLVTRKEAYVPGGYGMDPLPARSTLGAALLFGIGAVENGIGKYQFQQMRTLLEEFGYFDAETEFLPFWEQRRPEPGQTPGALFYHTAPGVLVSAYRNPKTKRLLLVLVNYTNQEIGKRGDLFVNHEQLLGKKWAQTPTGLSVKAWDPETGVQGQTGWNRKPGASGYIRDTWVEVGIRPGDYLLVEVE